MSQSELGTEGSSNPKTLILPGDAIQLNYTRLDPSDYTAHVDAKTPFALILGEAYSQGWILTVNGIPQANGHLLANSYANGWLINKTGNLNIGIVFETQSVVFPAYALTAATLIFIAAFLSLGALLGGNNILSKGMRKWLITVGRRKVVQRGDSSR